MKKLFQSIRDWFTGVRSYNWELERYLAGATDAADLEHRQRKWEYEMAHRNNFFLK